MEHMLLDTNQAMNDFTIPQTGHWMIETSNIDGGRVDVFKKMSPEIAKRDPDDPWCVVRSFATSGCGEYFLREGSVLRAITSDPGSYCLLTSPAPFNQHPEYRCRYIL